MAPALSPLQQEYRRLDLLRLERQGLDSKIASCEAHIAEMESAVGLRTPEDDGEATPAAEVPERVQELRERLGEGGGRRR